MMLHLEEKKCAIMPSDLNICVHCGAKATQLPGSKSGCTVYCGLPAVACGFPVFTMVETKHKGVSRLWSVTLNENLLEEDQCDSLFSYCIIFCHPIFSACQKCQTDAEITLTSLLD